MLTLVQNGKLIAYIKSPLVDIEFLFSNILRPYIWQLPTQFSSNNEDSQRQKSGPMSDLSNQPTLIWCKHVLIATRAGTNGDFYIQTFGHQNKRMFECLLRAMGVLLFIFSTCSYRDLLSITNLYSEALAKSGYEIKSLFRKDRLRNSTSLKFFACSSSSTSPLIAGCGCGLNCRMWPWPNAWMQFHVFECSSKQMNVRIIEHSSQN